MRDTFTYNELRHRVWILWNHTSHLILKCQDATFAEKTGLSHQQFLMLFTVECIGGPVTAIDLARRLERNANTVSTMLDRMESYGLVKKVRDMPDRRSVRLVMTDEGKKKLKAATKAGWGLIEKLMSAFSDEELQLFVRLLEKLRKSTLEELDPERALDVLTPENTPEEVEIKEFQKIVRLLEKADC